MKCPFCHDKHVEVNIKPWENIEHVTQHIIITKNNDGHVHYHGPMNHQIAMRMMGEAFKELGFEVIRWPSGQPTVSINMEYSYPSIYDKK